MNDLQDNIFKATHAGTLNIGERDLLCAVLEDKTRVISKTAIFKAFGRTKRGRKKDEIRVLNMPSFIDANNLQPFIDRDLQEVLVPLTYINVHGKITTGYKAEILPLLCDVYLLAREAGVLTKQQIPLAIASEIIVRSLSKVGIIALVDEATGYQAERDRNELHKILEAYISRELMPWTKRFPDEFYKELFRLRGWQYNPLSIARPGYAGTLTNELVYEKLPPGVLDELKTKNPKTLGGNRRYRHHQFLTDDIGNLHLEKHLSSVITLMRISSNWAEFEHLFNKAFPGSETQLEIEFEKEDQQNA